MEKLTLKTYPNPILSVPTKEVTEDQLELVKSYLPEMIRIMTEMNGVGLAANQVGISMSFAIIDLKKDSWYDGYSESPLLIINPKVVEQIDPVRVPEGCLSLPGFNEIVTRPSAIGIEYRDKNWILQKKALTGLMSQCVIHEINHLNGKLVFDEMSPMIKEMYKKKLKKKGLL